jgi:5-(carboxyamino)imidazole ribonucleotide mutase
MMAKTKSGGKSASRKTKILVGIIMGSKSDWPTMEEAAKMLDEFGIGYEVEVVSAHRTPDKMMEYAEGAKGRGLRMIIAGAGGAAHLPGMVAAKTSLPVLGVPVKSSALDGLDSLLSIAQMPAGIPVATFAIGVAGAKNAGLFAASVLALQDKAIARKLEKFRKAQTVTVLKGPDPRV